jgi:hypothetical protein
VSHRSRSGPESAGFVGGCRVNPAWPVAAVEISNEPAVTALGVALERDGWDNLIVAVGDIHTAVSFPDSLVGEEQSRPALLFVVVAVAQTTQVSGAL